MKLRSISIAFALMGCGMDQACPKEPLLGVPTGATIQLHFEQGYGVSAPCHDNPSWTWIYAPDWLAAYGPDPRPSVGTAGPMVASYTAETGTYLGEEPDASVRIRLLEGLRFTYLEVDRVPGTDESCIDEWSGRVEVLKAP